MSLFVQPQPTQVMKSLDRPPDGLSILQQPAACSSLSAPVLVPPWLLEALKSLTDREEEEEAPPCSCRPEQPGKHEPESFCLSELSICGFQGLKHRWLWELWY